MFYYNVNMIGAVPEFSVSNYPILNSVSGYLSGCLEQNITNADLLESRLKPIEWI